MSKQEDSIFKKTIVYADRFEFKSDNGNYFVEGYLSTPGLDLVDDIVTQNCIKDMYDQIEIGDEVSVMNGGVEHEHIIKNKDLIPIAKIVDKKIDENGLWINTQLNKHKSNFKEVWGSIEDKFLTGFSIEFIPREISEVGDKRILDKVDLTGFALTGRPACPGATFTDFCVKSKKLFSKEGKKMAEETKQEPDKEQEKPSTAEPVETEATPEKTKEETVEKEAAEEAKAEAEEEEKEETPKEEEAEEEVEEKAEAEEETAEAEESKSLTEDAVRKIIKEELKALQPQKKNLVERDEKFEVKSNEKNGFNFIKSFEKTKK